MRSRVGGNSDPDDEPDTDTFSPGQEKKSNPGGPNRNIGFSLSSYWGQAASFLENVGDVVSSTVSDYVAPISEDELDESREALSPDNEDQEESGNFLQFAGLINKSSVGASPTPIQNTQSVSNKIEQGYKPATLAQPAVYKPAPPPGTSLSLSVPTYDPRFTISAVTAPAQDMGVDMPSQSDLVNKQLRHTEMQNMSSTSSVTDHMTSHTYLQKPMSTHVPESDLSNVSLSSPAMSPLASPGTSPDKHAWIVDEQNVQLDSPQLEQERTEVVASSLSPQSALDMFVVNTSHDQRGGERGPALATRPDLAGIIPVLQTTNLAPNRLEPLSAPELSEKFSADASTEHDALAQKLQATQLEATRCAARAQTAEEALLKVHEELAQSRAEASGLISQLHQRPIALSSDLEPLRLEVQRLSDALQASEAALKEHEELLWQVKAHNSELLYALESERKDMAVVLQRRDQLQAQADEAQSRAAALEQRTIALEVQSASLAITAPTQISTANNETTDKEVSELRAELEAAQELIEHARQAYQLLDSQTKILQDDLAIERNERANVAASNEDLTRQLSKCGQEKTQLQLVITQLRASKRSTREDVEAVAAERNELQAKVESITSAWMRDSQALSQYTQKAEQGAEVTSQLQQELDVLRTQYREQQQITQHLQANVADLEKNNYDLNAHCVAVQADMIVLQQETERRSAEINNLRKALRQIEHDRENAATRAEQLQVAALAQSEERHASSLAKQRLEWESQLLAEREELKQMRQRVEDEALLRRKAQLDLNSEKKVMQKTLENALAQIRNPADDAVDRQLVANLIVSYLRKGRPAEVLELISKILGFNDTQMEAVGLRVPQTHFISNLFSTFSAGKDSSDAASSAPGESLAELWVSFLEAEAKTDGASGEDVDKESDKSKSATPAKRQARPSIGVR